MNVNHAPSSLRTLAGPDPEDEKPAPPSEDGSGTSIPEDRPLTPGQNDPEEEIETDPVADPDEPPEPE